MFYVFEEINWLWCRHHTVPLTRIIGAQFLEKYPLKLMATSLNVIKGTLLSYVIKKVKAVLHFCHLCTFTR